MQTTDLEFQAQNVPVALAFENLQTAILRLAFKPPIRPGTHGRQELGSLVEQALAAYRVYMKVVESK